MIPALVVRAASSSRVASTAPPVDRTERRLALSQDNVVLLSTSNRWRLEELLDVATDAAGAESPAALFPVLADLAAFDRDALGEFIAARGELLADDELGLVRAWLDTKRRYGTSSPPIRGRQSNCSTPKPARALPLQTTQRHRVCRSATTCSSISYPRVRTGCSPVRSYACR